MGILPVLVSSHCLYIGFVGVHGIYNVLIELHGLCKVFVRGT